MVLGIPPRRVFRVPRVHTGSLRGFQRDPASVFIVRQKEDRAVISVTFSTT